MYLRDSKDDPESEEEEEAELASESVRDDSAQENSDQVAQEEDGLDDSRNRLSAAHQVPADNCGVLKTRT